jgi:hypothetical protein
MGATRGHSLESPHAAGRLSDDCLSLQPAVEIEKTDDGEQDLCRGHVPKTSASDPHGAAEIETPRTETDAM